MRPVAGAQLPATGHRQPATGNHPPTTMLNKLQTTLNPAWYQGHHRRPPYFEGWYFKLIDATGANRYAIIPGIFKSGRPHAFVQVLDGQSGAATYHEFPPDAFWAATDRFEIRVGDNQFSPQGIRLALESAEQAIQGEVRFSAWQPWPVTLRSPGVMGWYAWVPTMECYHGVLSFDHELSGGLAIDGKSVDFGGGRGYVEKDWGQSFPQAWIWLQSNHFERPGVCLTGSIAIIPWRRTQFNGHIVGLWLNGRLYPFTTYSGARVVKLAVDEDTVQWVLRSKTHQLAILARRGATSHYGLLKGPTRQEMGKRVAESLTAVATLQLCELHGRKEREIFAGNGRYAGLEVHNVERLLVAGGW